MSETILVTGASGFIAGWCILSLLERGYRVRATLRDPAKEALVRATLPPTVQSAPLSFHVADLTHDAGWDEAVSGCDYVLHVASPLSTERTENPEELIAPARDGTLRVLRAAARAGVRRVVMTSSVAACSPPQSSPDSVTDETLWTDLKEPGLSAYRFSKTLAERAGWDFIKGSGTDMEWVTIQPTMVLGPVLNSSSLGSAQVVSRLLDGRMPGVPPVGFNIVDVRDVVELHLAALHAPAAAGQRFIANSAFLWAADIAQILRSQLGAQGAKVPSRPMSEAIFRMAAFSDPQLRALIPAIGRKRIFLADKATRVLGWIPRPTQEAVIACARSLLAR